MASNIVDNKVSCEVAHSRNTVESKPKNRTVPPRTGRRRGRKPLNINAAERVQLSRQSARECRARKKLRYQYVEELVASREKAVFALRNELEQLKQWCITMDRGQLTAECITYMKTLKQKLGDTGSAETLSSSSSDPRLDERADPVHVRDHAATSAVKDDSIVCSVPDWSRLLQNS